MKSLPLSVEIQDAAHQAAHPTAAAAPDPATGTVPYRSPHHNNQPNPARFRTVVCSSTPPHRPQVIHPHEKPELQGYHPTNPPTHPPPIAYNFTPQREEDQP